MTPIRSAADLCAALGELLTRADDDAPSDGEPRQLGRIRRTVDGEAMVVEMRGSAGERYTVSVEKVTT